MTTLGNKRARHVVLVAMLLLSAWTVVNIASDHAPEASADAPGLSGYNTPHCSTITLSSHGVGTHDCHSHGANYWVATTRWQAQNPHSLECGWTWTAIVYHSSMSTGGSPATTRAGSAWRTLSWAGSSRRCTVVARRNAVSVLPTPRGPSIETAGDEAQSSSSSSSTIRGRYRSTKSRYCIDGYNTTVSTANTLLDRRTHCRVRLVGQCCLWCFFRFWC